MFTYYLSREQVAGYAKDLAFRLDRLGENFPRIWCTLGHSGEEIANVVADYLPDYHKASVQIVPISYDRDRREISFQDSQDKAAFKPSIPVLVIDSSVHSGITMLAAFRRLSDMGVRSICTYSLVVKRGSCYVPNFFGFMMDEHDRAYFLLDGIPNYRVMPFGALRQLIQDDVHRNQQNIECGLASIDKVTWGDLWYEMNTRKNSVYLYEEAGEILGYISFVIKNAHLFIDAVAVDKKAQGKGLGGCLMRWAESCARSSNCPVIELWAINERIDFYRDKAKFTQHPETLDLGTEKYTRMSRKLLYNLKPRDFM